MESKGVVEDVVEDVSNRDIDPPESDSTVSSELETCRLKLNQTIKKLEKCERLNERLESYNKELTAQVKMLSQELAEYRCARYRQTECGVQVDQEELLACGVNTKPDWGKVEAPVGDKSQPASTLSIADSIKATAEAAIQQTGFVYEPTSGLYYDYNSGYYYDNERSLYYEPHSGTYYYYDATSQSYQIHSQVDVSQYYNQQHANSVGSQAAGLPKGECRRHRKRPKANGVTHKARGKKRPPMKTSEVNKSTTEDRSKRRKDTTYANKSMNEECEDNSLNIVKNNEDLTEIVVEYADNDIVRTSIEKNTVNAIGGIDKNGGTQLNGGMDFIGGTGTDINCGVDIHVINDLDSGTGIHVDEDINVATMVDDHTDININPTVITDVNKQTDLTVDVLMEVDTLENSENRYTQSASENDVKLTKREKSAVNLQMQENFCDNNNTNSGENNKTNSGANNHDVNDQEVDEKAMDICEDSNIAVDITESGENVVEMDKLTEASENEVSNHIQETCQQSHSHNDRDELQIVSDSQSLPPPVTANESRTLSESRTISKYAVLDSQTSSDGRNLSESQTISDPQTISDQHMSELQKESNQQNISAEPQAISQPHNISQPPSISDDPHNLSPSQTQVSDEGVSESESEYESGEVSASSDEEYKCTCDKRQEEMLEMNALNYPPCIRAIVQSSDVIAPGSLHIILCPGGTIGRDDPSHVINIPDPQIQQHELEMRYDDTAKKYQIWARSTDSVAKHNDTPLSVESSHLLSHRDTITIATTHILIHIHPGTDTCDDCEPGQVQAKLRSTQPREVVITTKEDKRVEMRRAKKKLMKKYGLANAAYESFDPSSITGDYADRAGDRRRMVGSDCPVERSAPPASTLRPIPVENKGRKMLEKLGWAEGESLGKTGTGIVDPVTVTVRLDQRKGLGSQNNHLTSADNVNLSSTQSSRRWIQTQKRFAKLADTIDVVKADDTASDIGGGVIVCDTGTEQKTTAGGMNKAGIGGTVHDKQAKGNWVKGPTQESS